MAKALSIVLVSLASLLLAAHADTQADLRSLSASETQDILKQWGLHEEFGDSFQKHGFDGLSLSLLENGDYSESTFPQATPLHFKMLLHKIGVTDGVTEVIPARRLAAKAPDTTGFIGLRVKQDKSVVALGEKGDVRLIRSGPSELSVSAAKTNFFGNVAVNGKPLGGKGSDLDGAMKRIAALEAQVKAMKGGTSSNSLSFDPVSAIGQATVAAICTAATYGGSGQTTAVRKDCGSKVKQTCKQVCAGLKLQCLESIHLYGNDGADGVHKKGIRTHTYGSCNNAGCGPNYCCCTEKLPSGNDFDAYNVLGQTLVNAVCTAAQLSAGGTGQTAAVRRKCSGSMTCEQICKGIKQKCIESVHMYGNDAADADHKKGMFTHLYGSCKSTGCGPNYCCCTEAPAPGASNTLVFNPNSAIGQATVAAICTGSQYGGTGHTTAVRKECGAKVKKTCKQVCEGLKLKCLESVHMYGNDGANGVHTQGIRTHLYGSCNAAGCGPNYCCCTSNPVDLDLGNDFDAHNVLGQTLVNAVCTAAQFSSGGSGQTAAVRRKCSGSMNCDQVCAGIKKKCIESIHMYGNDAANGVHKRGMFTHLYGSCKATGCGPNYCCCTDNLSGNSIKNALQVVGISPSGGLDQNGLIAQSMVQAACVGAYNKGSGQVAAFRKPCKGGSPTCAQLCKKVGHGSCFQSYHMYSGVAHNADFKKGFFNHLYGGCNSGGCGPNYCCCVK